MLQTLQKMRRRLLQMHFESKCGHIGGNLSAIDMLGVLFHQVLSPEDEFILSKGHAAGALYIALWSVGKLTDEDLQTFHKDATHLSGHPSPNWRSEIPFATGSLGHGLSLATGIALGKRLKQEPGHVYCLMSDGEWGEGSVWEAFHFAKHHRLSNLSIIIDDNGLQGFGSTKDVSGFESFSEMLAPYKTVRTINVDGHDPVQFREACKTQNETGPLVIVAKTTKGKGVSFMEDRMEWHYLNMSENNFHQAMGELGGHDAR
jgi:transketolase